MAAAILAPTALCTPAMAVDTDSDTGNIAVSLTVVDDCVLETQPLAFPESGVIDRDVTAETTITIECTRN
ncbi:spore coat protein U domain-containing protein, partial [Staphylococcus aureus]|nr:spore coat protein U domain-containing protein [Staphylococcus aureus]